MRAAWNYDASYSFVYVIYIHGYGPLRKLVRT